MDSSVVQGLVSRPCCRDEVVVKRGRGKGRSRISSEQADMRRGTSGTYNGRDLGPVDLGMSERGH